MTRRQWRAVLSYFGTAAELGEIAVIGPIHSPGPRPVPHAASISTTKRVDPKVLRKTFANLAPQEAELERDDD